MMDPQFGNQTDFQILEALADGRRDMAANIALTIDKNRNYLNTRLPILADEDLIHRVGPSESSGLYQITPRGVAAARNQSLYKTDREQFEAAVAEQGSLITITEPAVRKTSLSEQSADHE